MNSNEKLFLIIIGAVLLFSVLSGAFSRSDYIPSEEEMKIYEKYGEPQRSIDGGY